MGDGIAASGAAKDGQGLLASSSGLEQNSVPLMVWLLDVPAKLIFCKHCLQLMQLLGGGGNSRKWNVEAEVLTAGMTLSCVCCYSHENSVKCK